MKNVVNHIVSFLREDEGLTTVEYAVAGTMVAAAVVLAFGFLGTAVTGSINGLTTEIGGATS